MQKEADAQIGSQEPQHAGHELQLVVVDPYQASAWGSLGSTRGKNCVDLAIRGEVGLIEHRRHDSIVVERPQGGVAEAQIVLCGNVAIEHDLVVLAARVDPGVYGIDLRLIG